ncbi:sulfite reductase (NADPH) hemoprotein beta-component [Methylohalomonas lacus]|uniref:Sulfite reductase [NADPH] hemoprotein beta-component n=1 Tax=Methylohalomonas lacus TaxID=398773 RepID=A0AAE3HL34_9GAMM|nr:assimilatory sulfite reductase (NADPH) hemoprotein subunit [Methylohalomonas lacus]MCS3903213.1 sulfite reductase (NADPH) hemoprotein beta-component [Methylohalomonas lacus]
MVELKPEHSPVEHIKANSNRLRGSIAEGLLDKASGAIADDDTQLTKFHGIYQQDDRRLRDERRHQKLEPYYQFMIRLRLPGGVLSPQEWLALDDLAHRHGNATLRLTTRQTFQFHGVLKEHLKPLMQGINAAGLDTRGGCGDVNRNVIANTNPHRSALHAEVHDYTRSLSERLLWHSRAYEELWLDAAPNEAPEYEPLYGETYMPRKFKIAIAVPPENDCDVFANDIGLIGIADDDGGLAGFNVAVGGGFGMTYGEPETYPRLGSVIGYIDKQYVVDVAEQIVAIQRDFGDRVERKHARLKYTIDDRGLDWFRDTLAERLGYPLAAAQPYEFKHNGDRYGWIEGTDGHYHLTLFIAAGRIADFDDYALMSGVRELASIHHGEIRLTGNQNLIFANVPATERERFDAVIERYGLDAGQRSSALRRASMACVAFPTCGLAMAEAERYIPAFIDKLEAIMKAAGLGDDERITVRMTGCPNGCARPYLAEIALTGRALGKYNVYLGGNPSGERLNKLYRENIGEEEILETLEPLIQRYASERNAGEAFGDFVIRAGIIAATREGRDFHEQTPSHT